MKVTKVKKASDIYKKALALIVAAIEVVTLASCSKKDDKEIIDIPTNPIVETTTMPTSTEVFEEKTTTIDPYANDEGAEIKLFFKSMKEDVAKYGDVEVFEDGFEYGIKINSVKNYEKLSDTINRYDNHFNISFLECDVAIFEKLNLDLKGISDISLYSTNGVYISKVDLSKYKTLDSIKLTDAGVARLAKGITKLEIIGTDKENKHKLNVEEELGSLYATYGVIPMPGNEEHKAYNEAGKYLGNIISIKISNANLSGDFLDASHNTCEMFFDNCELNSEMQPCCTFLTIDCVNCNGTIQMNENTVVREKLNINDENNIELPNNEYCFGLDSIITRNGVEITNSLDAKGK